MIQMKILILIKVNLPILIKRIFFKKKIFFKTKKSNKNPDVDDLFKRMKNLTISTCFYLKEKGHFQNNCLKTQGNC